MNREQSPDEITKEIRDCIAQAKEADFKAISFDLDEAEAMADLIDHQHGVIVHRGQQLLADAVLAERQIIVAKLLRHFVMRPIHVPGGDDVRAWLADYLDLEGWGPIPWPKGCQPAAQFLNGMGLFCIDGFVARPKPSAAS